MNVDLLEMLTYMLSNAS